MTERERAIETLRRMIIRGEIRTDDMPMTERHLTEVILEGQGFTRHVIREALAVISNQGLVRQYPVVGFRIPQMDMGSALECLRYQYTIGSHIITGAVDAVRNRGAALGETEDSFKKLETLSRASLGDFMEQETDIHSALARIGQYSTAAHSLRGIRDKLQLFFLQQEYKGEGYAALVLPEYRMLLNGLQARNPKAAKAHLRQLTEITERIVVRL